MRFVVLLTALGFSLFSFSQSSMPVASEEALTNAGTLATSTEYTSPRNINDVAPDLIPLLRANFTVKDADHVANGVAMRNRTSGTIHLRGVPNGSTVALALLYWNFIDNNKVGPTSMPALFNGNLVTGTRTADSDDPCWVLGGGGSHSYVANVTSFVNTTSHPNQDYDVVLLFSGVTVTSGENPWPSQLQSVRPEGATLIVIYQNNNTLGEVNVYHDLNNSMFTGIANFGFSHSPAPSFAADLFTTIGADGQLGGGLSRTVANETTTFNGVQIAGPPITHTNWDGSDGWPLVQLWDTHTHQVTLGTATSLVTFQSFGDCLVPVAFVLDAN